MTELKNKYGKWALITGASSGIGKSYAYYLAEKGLNLVLVARRIELLNEIKNDLTKKNNVDVRVIIADLSSRSGIEKVIIDCADFEVGILINNAGFGKTGIFTNNSAELIEDMINVNCLAPTLLTNHFVKKMILNRKGAIIFLGSVVANLPVPYMSLYSATKSFNLALGKTLWYEFRKYNIDVITVNPGSTSTEFDGLGIKNNNKFVRKPDQVVKTTFLALGKKQTVTDGKINKLLFFLSNIFGSTSSIKLSGNYANKIIEKKS
ncbi:MAG: SDR family oxidoreductase [Bacteroidetes bacterium]|nr:SDR family oxidoreductase [Bacteroidota bacterium]